MNLHFKKVFVCLIASPAAVLAAPSFAGCWNAADSGVVGPAVEICIDGRCETATLTFECANASGLQAGYTNGLSVNIDISVEPNQVVLSRNGTRLSAAQIATATCRDIESDGCKFGKTPVNAIGDADAEGQLALIRSRFAGLIGVDAEGFQSILFETGLYAGAIDGVWGANLEAAVREALRLAAERGIAVDLTSDQAMFGFLYAVRDAYANPDSGLSQQPFAGAHLLVVASRQSYEEAEPIAASLEAALAATGFPGRTSIIPSLNGWLALTAGMYNKDECLAQADALKGQGLLPADAYCAPVEKFDPFYWTN